ncbi:hypothetical protein N9L12_08225 [Luminiphilus sp.]|nr:hypothetical protein [Luminiphilus sp.]
MNKLPANDPIYGPQIVCVVRPPQRESWAGVFILACLGLITGVLVGGAV